MGNTPKIVSLIRQSQAMKARMKELEATVPEVAEYIQLDKERKDVVHKAITSHVKQYNVNPDLYKSQGLVGRLNRTVKVTDVETLAQVRPDLSTILLPLIRESKSFYAK